MEKSKIKKHFSVFDTRSLFVCSVLSLQFVAQIVSGNKKKHNISLANNLTPNILFSDLPMLLVKNDIENNISLYRVHCAQCASSFNRKSHRMHFNLDPVDIDADDILLRLSHIVEVIIIIIIVSIERKSSLKLYSKTPAEKRNK